MTTTPQPQTPLRLLRTNCTHCGDRTIDIQIIDGVVICNPCIDDANESD